MMLFVPLLFFFFFFFFFFFCLENALQPDCGLPWLLYLYTFFHKTKHFVVFELIIITVLKFSVSLPSEIITESKQTTHIFTFYTAGSIRLIIFVRFKIQDCHCFLIGNCCPLFIIELNCIYLKN